VGGAQHELVYQPTYSHMEVIELAQRVLATEEAVQAAQKMKTILNGPLTDQLRQLERCGAELERPDQWDGRDSQIFRQRWTNDRRTLDNCINTLKQLQQDSEKVVRAIRTAGGDAS